MSGGRRASRFKKACHRVVHSLTRNTPAAQSCAVSGRGFGESQRLPRTWQGLKEQEPSLLAPSSLLSLTSVESELSILPDLSSTAGEASGLTKSACFSRILVVVEYGRKSNTDLLLFVFTIYFFRTGHHPKERVCAVWEFSCDDLRVLASV